MFYVDHCVYFYSITYPDITEIDKRWKGILYMVIVKDLTPKYNGVYAFGFTKKVKIIRINKRYLKGPGL